MDDKMGLDSQHCQIVNYVHRFMNILLCA